ncbi:hypothetical protein LJR230_005197 [Trinickia sp. LjRoot230]|uniref:hypothetical protein n=1 Tax=Trinickia sp. LjRoot230 TaxID=3342288 RepID=UPI003ECFEF28
MENRIEGGGSESPQFEPEADRQLSNSNVDATFSSRPASGVLDALADVASADVRFAHTAEAKARSLRASSHAFSPDFNPPRQARVAGYRVVPLTEDHLEADVAAINSSLAKIKELRGGTWPSGPIDRDEDRNDLIVHREEFERRGSYAYCIISEDGKTSAGCIYIYPPNHSFDDSDRSAMPSDADAAVSCWVTQAAYDRGLYPVVYRFIEEWLRTSWPFQRPYISSRNPF